MVNILEKLHLRHKPLSIHTGRRYPEIKELGAYARSLPPGQRSEGIRRILQENGYEQETVWSQGNEKYKEL